MSDYYLDEYLQSAQEQGTRDFWDGRSKPDIIYSALELVHWRAGWDDAHEEQMEIATNDIG